MKYYSAFIFLSIAMTPVASQAATITQILGPSEVSIAGPRFFNSVTEQSDNAQAELTVDLQQFDPSLGTLDSVQIYLQADVGHLFSLQNESDEAQDFNARSEAVFSASWTGAEDPLQNTSVLEEVFEVAPYNPSEPALVQFFGATFGGKLFVPDTAPFAGTDTLAVDMTLDLSAKVSTADGVTFSIAGANAFQGFGIGFLTYNYTEAADETPPEVIPLPAGLPLLATALGLGALLRHRRR